MAVVKMLLYHMCVQDCALMLNADSQIDWELLACMLACLLFDTRLLRSKNVAGKSLHSNQYSVTEYYSPVHKGEVQLPAIYFLYDLSPIMVLVKDSQDGLAHLLVRICAVVGGVFAVTGKQHYSTENASV